MIIDFHIHSKYSFDCFLEPARIIELARKHGLDGFAVTDHDTMSGIPEFRSLAPDLYIIAGQEISTKDGDILGIFLKKEIKTTQNSDQAIEEIRKQGGLAVLAHPYKWPHLIRHHEFLKKFDAIEAFNARNNIPVPYLENFLGAKCIKKWGLSFVAGSDVHEGFELGCAKTIFDFTLEEADDEKIKKAILQRRIKIAGEEVALLPEIISHFSRNIKSALKT